MATANEVPASNVNALWAENAHTALLTDDNIHVRASKDDDNEAQAYNMTNDALAQNITEIKVWIRHFRAGGSWSLSINVGGSIQSLLVPFRSSETLDSLTFAGSWSQDQFEAIRQCIFTSGSIGEDEDIRIDEMFWELTYDPTTAVIKPATVQASLTLHAPTILRGTTRTPDTLSLTIALHAPSLLIGCVLAAEALRMRVFLRGGGVKTLSNFVPWWMALEPGDRSSLSAKID